MSTYAPKCEMAWREMVAGADTQLCASEPAKPADLGPAKELSASMRERRARGLEWLAARGAIQPEVIR